MRRFREALQAGEFVVTAELEPPKGTDLTPVLNQAKALVGLVHGVNVTDNQTAVMRMCPLAVCKYLLDLGLDPIMQVTVRDRNRMAIQSDLLGAHALGIRNVLSLTGDPMKVGDHKDAKPVFELESTQILELIGSLNHGKDLAGNDLQGSTDLHGGAAASPDSPNQDLELAKFEKKVSCGARFFQTQGVYDPHSFEQFVSKVKRFNTKLLAGIIVLKSAKMAEYMNSNIPGIKVPEPLVEELRKVSDKEQAIQVGIEIAARTIRAVRDLCDGVHIMAVGMRERVPEIIHRAGLV
ncbi:MAG: methylenetetrahydrofolate reductase [Nitrospiria bacterium]